MDIQLTNDSRMEWHLPERLRVITATEYEATCSGVLPKEGSGKYVIFVTFPMNDVPDVGEYIAYGRCRLDEDGTMLIIPQSPGDIDRLNGLEAGDAWIDVCGGCSGKVADLADLEPAFGRAYELLDVVPKPQQQTDEALIEMLTDLAELLGVEVDDEPSLYGNLPTN